jgi:hypothetical protein
MITDGWLAAAGRTFLDHGRLAGRGRAAFLDHGRLKWRSG